MTWNPSKDTIGDITHNAGQASNGGNIFVMRIHNILYIAVYEYISQWQIHAHVTFDGFRKILFYVWSMGITYRNVGIYDTNLYILFACCKIFYTYNNHARSVGIILYFKTFSI